MSWLARTFAIYIPLPQDEDDVGILFFHPPVPEAQQNALVGACRASNGFLQNFAPDSHAEVIEIGDAKIAIHHDVVCVALGASGEYPDNALQAMLKDVMGTLQLFNGPLQRLLDVTTKEKEEDSQHAFNEAIANVARYNLLPAVAMLRSNALRGFNILPAPRLPSNCTRFFVLGWQILSTLKALESVPSFGACLIWDGTVLCCDMAYDVARYFLPVIDSVQRLQIPEPQYRAYPLWVKRSVIQSAQTPVTTPTTPMSPPQPEGSEESLEEIGLFFHVLPHVALAVLTTKDFIKERAIPALVRETQPLLQKLGSAATALEASQTVAPTASQDVTSPQKSAQPKVVTQQLVYEGSKQRATGDMDDEFLQLVNTAHDMFAERPDLTEAVFCHATGDALLCRRMFDKEIFFRTSGALIRRAADVEKTAQETLAQQKIFFV